MPKTKILEISLEQVKREKPSLRSVCAGQGRCPGGEVLEVPAVFIHALTCELVNGHGVSLLSRGRV